MLGWLVRFAWWRARRRPGPAVRTLSIGGLQFTLDWAAAEHVSLREIMTRGEYWPSPEFRPSAGQVVVDVGANAGVFATLAASWIGPSGRLVAIEPNPFVLERLRRNLRENRLEAWTEVVAAGLSDHLGAAILHVGANSTIGTIAPSTGPSDSSIEISLETLDHLAVRIALPPIDLLKMDVEGLELPALDGASAVLRRCRRLVLEVSNTRDLAGVTDRCRAAGFDEIVDRPAGLDSGATIVFARRTRIASAGALG
jgi:FkbM family methyltransferase